MSSVETGQISAVETGEMSAAETGQMSAVETRQMWEVSDQGSGPKSPKWSETGPEWLPGHKNRPKSVLPWFRSVSDRSRGQTRTKKGLKPRNRPVWAPALGFDSSGSCALPSLSWGVVTLCGGLATASR